MQEKEGKIKKMPPLFLRRMYKNFTIFYRSKYGKAGFYILLAFAVITMLTPYIGGNAPYYQSAPGIDTSLACLVHSSNLNNVTGINTSSELIFSPMGTSEVLSTYTGAIYFGTSNGNLYAVGLGKSPSFPLGGISNIYNSNLPPNVHMKAPVLFDLINGSKLANSDGEIASYERFVVMPYSNGTIRIGTIDFYNRGLSSPVFKSEGLYKINGSIIGNVTTNGNAFSGLVSTPDPTFDYNTLAGMPRGEIYLTVHNSTGIYLKSYSVEPFKLINSTKINMGTVQGITVYGKEFYQTRFHEDGRIIIYNGTTIEGFATNLTKIWQDNITNLNARSGLYIPSYYQSGYKHTNAMYIAYNGNSIGNVTLKNGSLIQMFKADADVNQVTTTGSVDVNRPHSIVVTTHNSTILYSLNLTLNTYTKFSAPYSSLVSGEILNHGVYDSLTESLVFTSEKGISVSVNLSAKHDADLYYWSYPVSPVPTSVSTLLYFHDAETGKGAISFITNTGVLYILGSTASSYAPLPPMIKTPSGNSYPMGTTFYVKANLWARFLQSFGNDWIFGIVIGIFTLVISLAVAMYIGYKGGIGGEILETFTLALFLVPTLALLIALSSVISGANFITLILIVSLTGWPYAAFTLIGIVRSVSSRNYIEASRLFGARGGSIMAKHILPNIGPLLIYLLALSIGGGIGAVSGLEFLGLAPLKVATWGGMLNAVLKDEFYLISQPQWILPPAIALAAFISALIFMSRGMDDVVNPRLRRR